MDCSPLSMGFPRPGKNTGVGCHFLLQGIFLTQGWNSCLLHWQEDSLPLSHQGSPNFPCKKVLNHNFNFFDIGLFRFSISVLLTCNFQGFYPDYLRFLFGGCENILVLLSANLEKGMAPHSSTLAWKTPWTEEPGGLQSMGSLRVGHDWVTLLSLFTFMHWRRKWQPTPAFLPGESQGRGSLVGCRLRGYTELDTNEAT